MKHLQKRIESGVPIKEKKSQRRKIPKSEFKTKRPTKKKSKKNPSRSLKRRTYKKKKKSKSELEAE